ncbi:hypothetical protein [Candidatus Magnetobacterium casense]|uniref:Uncharacterized protein n=1 Tax=Candidatus Magnetobacterium casense TaxID=1455061 RepID=A0ABS6RVP5_9BACT|nr:hypothetical protein [Candidatus Magnetobacterium casensis]MBV6340343.1 hypothetical protein [Candidatus Magnetobacterium casensis]
MKTPKKIRGYETFSDENPYEAQIKTDRKWAIRVWSAVLILLILAFLIGIIVGQAEAYTPSIASKSIKHYGEYKTWGVGWENQAELISQYEIDRARHNSSRICYSIGGPTRHDYFAGFFCFPDGIVKNNHGYKILDTSWLNQELQSNNKARRENALLWQQRLLHQITDKDSDSSS